MTTIGIVPGHRPAARGAHGALIIDRALLAAGVLSSLLYVATDLACAARYPGYNLADQAISELSAVGSPTRALWTAIMPLYGALVLAFGVGMLRVAGRARAARATGMLLVAFALSGAIWQFFPMHQRGATFDWRDVGHIVLSIATVAMILVFIAVGAYTLGRRFRLYSFATIAALAIAGAVTFSWADRLASGQPTPRLGIVERVNIYGYLLWIAVLSVAFLMRTSNARRTP